MAYMTADALAHSMRLLINERIDVIKNNMAHGAAFKTLEAYRDAIGEVRGLKTSLELIDEAEKKVRENERGL